MRSLIQFVQRFIFAFRSGFDSSLFVPVSRRERELEIKRLKYKAAQFESAKRRAEIQRAQFDLTPVWFCCAVGGLGLLLMTSMCVYAVCQPLPKPEKVYVSSKGGTDPKYPDKCNPSNPGMKCTLHEKKTKKPIVVILLPPRKCDQNESQDSPCYYPPPSESDPE